MVRPAVLILAIFLGTLALQGQSTITCPAANAGHLFDRISIFNGKQAGQEFELAPDDEKNVRGKITQSWILKDYRSMNLFLRCRYQGTEAVLAQDIPVSIQTCTFTFDIDRKGKITGGRSFACR